MQQQILRPVAEQRYREELEALRVWDQFNRKPINWQLSPKAVRMFILGSGKPLSINGREITIQKKYLGNDALVERCIITLAGNRGLMLVGEPGTAKTMLSELLSAAISGCSTNTVQGTAGTTEDMIKYSFNYAMLLANGPSREALVPSPLYVGMEKGILTRFEEITRTPAEVQDSLISVLSDKVMNIPELGDSGLLFAKPGFNVIGTADAGGRAWYRKDHAVGAAQRRHQRMQYQHRPGYRRHHRGYDQIQLQLRHAAGQRPQSGGTGALPPVCGHGKGNPDPV